MYFEGSTSQTAKPTGDFAIYARDMLDNLDSIPAHNGVCAGSRNLGIIQRNNAKPLTVRRRITATGRTPVEMCQC